MTNYQKILHNYNNNRRFQQQFNKHYRGMRKL